jgi:excinuclease ABC subunit B
MGIATWHEFAPSKGRDKPRKPNLDEMGPGVESVPGKRENSGPRSTMGRAGMRGGWKPRGR